MRNEGVGGQRCYEGEVWDEGYGGQVREEGGEEGRG